jgi:hypothetical protein
MIFLYSTISIIATLLLLFGASEGNGSLDIPRQNYANNQHDRRLTDLVEGDINNKGLNGSFDVTRQSYANGQHVRRLTDLV